MRFYDHTSENLYEKIDRIIIFHNMDQSIKLIIKKNNFDITKYKFFDYQPEVVHKIFPEEDSKKGKNFYRHFYFMYF